MYPSNRPYSPEFMSRRHESDSAARSEDPATSADPNSPESADPNSPNYNPALAANADPAALPETSPSLNQSESLTSAPEFQDHMSELAGQELPMVHLDQKIAIEPTFSVPDEKLQDGDEIVARGTDSALVQQPEQGKTKIISNYLDDRLWSNEVLTGHHQAMTDLHALCLDTAIVDLNSQDQDKLDDAVQKYHQLLEYRDQQASPSEQTGINICLGRLMEQGPAFRLIAQAGAPEEEVPATAAEAESEPEPEAPVLPPETLETVRAQRQQFLTQLEDLGRQQRTVEHILDEFSLSGRVDPDELSASLTAARANLNTLEQDNQALSEQIDSALDDVIDLVLDYDEAEVSALVSKTPDLDAIAAFSGRANFANRQWIESRRQQIQQLEQQLARFTDQMESLHSQF